MACTQNVFSQTRVGVVIDGAWERNAELRALFESEILDLTRGEFTVEFPDEKRIVADWSLAGVDAALDALLSDPDVDLVLTMGLIASNAVSRRTDLQKPVIAPFVIDARIQGLPIQDGASGVANLNYISLPTTFERDLAFFQDMLGFSKVSILINKRVSEAIPDLLANIRLALTNFEIDPVLIAVDTDGQEAIAAIPQESEAVYVLPLIHLPQSEFDAVVSGLIDRKLPSFSLLGRREVERGLMASLSPDMFPRIARRVALNLQEILLGRPAGQIPVAFAIGEELSINMATVRAVEARIPFSAMSEAELIQPIRTTADRELTLLSVMRQVVGVNLEFAAKLHEISAGEGDVRSVRSALLPQLSIGGLALQIDRDRAAASFGSAPQRKLSGTATLTQLIYSNEAWTGLQARRAVQRSLQAERETLRLDLIQSAASAYLQVLRAKTRETIERENLKRTRKNLELARVRESVGFSGRSDVYRWESQIANNLQTVILANSQRNLAEIELNRLLHEELEAPFETLDSDLDEGDVLQAHGPLVSSLEGPTTFRKLRAFMVDEGLRRAPELRVLDELIGSQKAVLDGTARAFWAPTVAIQAELDRTLAKGGAGSESGGLVPGTPEADDVNWSAAVNLSYDLITGGRKAADRHTARETLSQLEVLRDAAAERVEQRVRSALHVAGASFAAIKLSRDAADAAGKNLQLVVDAYSSGAVSVIDLIDAQNAALLADLGASNAVYTFLIDFIEIQRSAGVFADFLSGEQRAAFYQRLEDFTETGN